MFGYIVTNKPELKIKEFEEYREYYCGLCKRLSKNHGIKCKLCLKYDYIFLILLLTGLYEPDDERHKERCMIHPLKKHYVKYNKYTDYVSDMGVILARIKCMDDWKDERKLLMGCMGGMLYGEYRRIALRYPEKIETIEQCMKNISKAENEDEQNVDIISGYFGKAFSEVCVVEEDRWERILRSIGFYLGKYIYILDAYDDIEKDIRDNNYNPFKRVYHDKNFPDMVKRILMVNAAQCAREFEKLPIVNEVEILRNILYSGIWSRFDTITDRRKKNEKSL